MVTDRTRRAFKVGVRVKLVGIFSGLGNRQGFVFRTRTGSVGLIAETMR